MYAILEVQGKQYKVAAKDEILVNLLDKKQKDKVILDKVLLVADGEKVEIGQPFIKGASVEAEVVDQIKGKKVVIYKYLRRKDSHKKTGHRQKLTKLLIKKINI